MAWSQQHDMRRASTLAAAALAAAAVPLAAAFAPSAASLLSAGGGVHHRAGPRRGLGRPPRLHAASTQHEAQAEDDAEVPEGRELVPEARTSFLLKN